MFKLLWRLAFWRRRYPLQQFGPEFCFHPYFSTLPCRLSRLSCSSSLMPTYIIVRVDAVMTLHDSLRFRSSIFMHVCVWLFILWYPASMGDILTFLCTNTFSSDVLYSSMFDPPLFPLMARLIEEYFYPLLPACPSRINPSGHRVLMAPYGVIRAARHRGPHSLFIIPGSPRNMCCVVVVPTATPASERAICKIPFDCGAFCAVRVVVNMYQPQLRRMRSRARGPSGP